MNRGVYKRRLEIQSQVREIVRKQDNPRKLTEHMRVGQSRSSLIAPDTIGYLKVVGCETEFCRDEDGPDENYPLGDYLYEFIAGDHREPIAVYRIDSFKDSSFKDRKIAELTRLV